MVDTCIFLIHFTQPKKKNTKKTIFFFFRVELKKKKKKKKKKVKKVKKKKKKKKKKQKEEEEKVEKEEKEEKVEKVEKEGEKPWLLFWTTVFLKVKKTPHTGPPTFWVPGGILINSNLYRGTQSIMMMC